MQDVMTKVQGSHYAEYTSKASFTLYMLGKVVPMLALYSAVFLQHQLLCPEENAGWLEASYQSDVTAWKGAVADLYENYLSTWKQTTRWMHGDWGYGVGDTEWRDRPTWGYCVWNKVGLTRQCIDARCEQGERGAVGCLETQDRMYVAQECGGTADGHIKVQSDSSGIFAHCGTWHCNWYYPQAWAMRLCEGDYSPTDACAQPHQMSSPDANVWSYINGYNPDSYYVQTDTGKRYLNLECGSTDKDPGDGQFLETVFQHQKDLAYSVARLNAIRTILPALAIFDEKAPMSKETPPAPLKDSAELSIGPIAFAGVGYAAGPFAAGGAPLNTFTPLMKPCDTPSDSCQMVELADTLAEKCPNGVAAVMATFSNANMGDGRKWDAYMRSISSISFWQYRTEIELYNHGMNARRRRVHVDSEHGDGEEATEDTPCFTYGRDVFPQGSPYSPSSETGNRKCTGCVAGEDDLEYKFIQMIPGSAYRVDSLTYRTAPSSVGGVSAISAWINLRWAPLTQSFGCALRARGRLLPLPTAHSSAPSLPGIPAMLRCWLTDP